MNFSSDMLMLIAICYSNRSKRKQMCRWGWGASDKSERATAGEVHCQQASVIARHWGYNKVCHLWTAEFAHRCRCKSAQRKWVIL